MGHDIYAYPKPAKESAYLRRGAFNDDARTIYRLLDAAEYDAGVSGDGSWAIFYRDQLEQAISRAEAENAEDDIKSFLKSALESDPGDDGVLIHFG